MKFADFKHDGKTYAISVTEVGTFSTSVGDIGVHADSFDTLKEKIVRATRKASVRLALPATYVQGRGRWSDERGPVTLVDVVITGIHQRNRDILARRVGGKEDALRLSGHSGEILKRLTAAQAEEYQALRKARDNSSKAFEAFEKKYDYTIDEIEAAVEHAEHAAGIEPEPKEARR